MTTPYTLPILNRIVITGATAAGNFKLPTNCSLVDIYPDGTNANAVTGGLKFGTTAGAADIVAAQAVAGNSLNSVPAANLLRRRFSKTSSQQIFYDAVTSWNGANVDITVVYQNLNNG